MERRNTYRLFGTLSFKKSKFNRRIGGWDSTSVHRQGRQLTAVEKKLSKGPHVPPLPLLPPW